MIKLIIEHARIDIISQSKEIISRKNPTNVTFYRKI